MTVARKAHSLGIAVVWEWSQRCTAWSLPEYLAFAEELKMHTGVCNGCQVNLRNSEGLLPRKAWRIDSTWAELAQTLNARATTNEGNASPASTARRTTPLSLRNGCQQTIQQDILGAWAFVGENPDANAAPEGAGGEEEEEERAEGEAEADADMSVEDKKRALTGHCSNKHLVQTLQRQNASPQVLKLARDFKCDICKEWSRPNPRNPATLQTISRKWETIMLDCGYWKHARTGEKWLFILAVDEGSRLRVGRLVRSGNQEKIFAEDVCKFLTEQWFAVFGHPGLVRTDAAGSLRSKEFDEFLQNSGIGIEHAFFEAHWQMSPVERGIQATKEIVSKLSSEYPEMSCHELFCRALWAQNHRDMYLGDSPLQHTHW